MVEDSCPSAAPTVFIVDNDPVVRKSLVWLIESAKFATRGFATGEAFLEACAPDTAGCAILDVRLPGIGGEEVFAELRRRDVPLPVIIITGYADVPLAVRLLKSGAFDLIEKPCAEHALLARVRQAVENDAAARARRALSERSAALLRRLTTRERDVFELVIHGKANKVVAYDLGISQKTVETHRARVMQKLQARSLADLVRVGLVMEHAHAVDAGQRPWIAAERVSVAAGASRIA